MAKWAMSIALGFVGAFMAGGWIVLLKPPIVKYQVSYWWFALYWLDVAVMVERIEDVITPSTDEDDMKLNAEVSLVHSDLLNQTPRSAAIAVRTQHNFACVNYSAK